jgi:hypothetical protein
MYMGVAMLQGTHLDRDAMHRGFFLLANKQTSETVSSNLVRNKQFEKLRFKHRPSVPTQLKTTTRFIKNSPAVCIVKKQESQHCRHITAAPGYQATVRV